MHPGGLVERRAASIKVEDIFRLLPEGIRHPGGFCTLASGWVASLPISPASWAQRARRWRRAARRQHDPGLARPGAARAHPKAKRITRPCARPA